MSSIDMRKLPAQAASARADQHTGARTATLRASRITLEQLP